MVVTPSQLETNEWDSNQWPGEHERSNKGQGNIRTVGPILANANCLFSNKPFWPYFTQGPNKSFTWPGFTNNWPSLILILCFDRIFDNSNSVTLWKREWWEQGKLRPKWFQSFHRGLDCERPRPCRPNRTSGCDFINVLQSIFYARKSQMRKKTVKPSVSFCTFGSKSFA